MARHGRRSTCRIACAEDGCGEVAFFECDEPGDYQRIWREQNKKWRCIRHLSPGELLGPANRTRAVVLTVGTSDRTSGLYWVKPDGHVGSGFQHGPGFMAFAQDFPAGTTLRVSAEIVLPESSRDDSEGVA